LRHSVRIHKLHANTITDITGSWGRKTLTGCRPLTFWRGLQQKYGVRKPLYGPLEKFVAPLRALMADNEDYQLHEFAGETLDRFFREQIARFNAMVPLNQYIRVRGVGPRKRD
jgi:hypothetical protein